MRVNFSKVLYNFVFVLDSPTKLSGFETEKYNIKLNPIMKYQKALLSLKQAMGIVKKGIIRSLNEPFVKVTCTIIAGILGWWLGAQYQDKNWKEQYTLSTMESDRKQAEVIFNEISRLMDDRYYKTVRLLSAYKQNDSIKIQRYTQSLILQLEEWNANRHRNYSLIEGYFGIQFKTFYKQKIQEPFAQTGNHIIYTGAATVKDQNMLSKKLNSIEVNITIFNRMMLNAIKQNKVGRFNSDSL